MIGLHSIRRSTVAAVHARGGDLFSAFPRARTSLALSGVGAIQEWRTRIGRLHGA
jgi:hypothetical protein